MDDLTLDIIEQDGGVDELIEAIHAGFSDVPFPPDVEPHEQVPFAIALRDENGRIQGGVTGHAVWGWLYVRYLWVDDRWRGCGQGARLMQAAEAEAEKLGCIGVWVSTYSFQAPTFYQKLGYLEFGRIGDFPKGHCRLFYQKRLAP